MKNQFCNAEDKFAPMSDSLIIIKHVLIISRNSRAPSIIPPLKLDFRSLIVGMSHGRKKWVEHRKAKKKTTIKTRERTRNNERFALYFLRRIEFAAPLNCKY